MSGIDTMNQDRRREPRRRALLFGTMQFPNGTTSMTCHIRNLSGNGARLEVANAGWLDRRFDLLIGARNQRVPAEIIWRSSDAVGIRFPEGSSGSLSLEEEVVLLRAERDRLKARIQELTNAIQDLSGADSVLINQADRTRPMIPDA